jgi:hypothetical protein
MKKLLRLAAAVAVFAAVQLGYITLAQVRPEGESWKLLGEDKDGYTYALKTDQIERNKETSEVRFIGIAYLDKDNFEISAFLGDCTSGKAAPLGMAGKLAGKEFLRKPEKLNKVVPPKDSALALAVRTACTIAFGDFM